MRFFFIEQLPDGQYQVCATDDFFGPIFSTLEAAERDMAERELAGR